LNTWGAAALPSSPSLSGSADRITAFGVHEDLAARTRRDLSAWPQKIGALA
jgi:hypothetical protein